jgi:hypothetical protein
MLVTEAWTVIETGSTRRAGSPGGTVQLRPAIESLDFPGGQGLVPWRFTPASTVALELTFGGQGLVPWRFTLVEIV